VPRYFFHIQDGRFDPDMEGTELPDIYAAHYEAIRAGGEMLRSMGVRFWDHGSWAMKVHDENDNPLFTIKVTLEEHIDSGRYSSRR
jgi:hypothetical protein